MRISDWSSDVCSSDLQDFHAGDLTMRSNHPDMIAHRYDHFIYRSALSRETHAVVRCRGSGVAGDVRCLAGEWPVDDQAGVAQRKVPAVRATAADARPGADTANAAATAPGRVGQCEASDSGRRRAEEHTSELQS